MHRTDPQPAAQRWRRLAPQPPGGLRLRSASIDAIAAGGMPSSLRSPPGPIRVSRGLPARSAVLSSTPARSGRRVQQLHPADTCGRRRRQVVSRASSHIRAVGFSGVQSGWVWAPEPASKPDVDPVPDPAVSAAADPEVRGSVASRCRAQRSTARPSPTRSSRPCGSQPSQRAQDRFRTGSCRWSRSMRATSFVQEGSD